jgi:hypothetical protein
MMTDEGPGTPVTMGRPLTAQDIDHAALGYLWGRYLPWWWMFIRGGLLLALYRNEVGETVKRTRQLLGQLRVIEGRNPALYAEVVRTWRAEFVKEVPRSFTLQDPAFLVGRLLRASDEEASGGQIAVVGLEVAGILLVLHLPGALLVSLGKAAALHAGALLKEELGIAGDAAEVAGKQALAEELRSLQGKADALRPGIDQLAQLLGRTGEPKTAKG